MQTPVTLKPQSLNGNVHWPKLHHVLMWQSHILDVSSQNLILYWGHHFHLLSRKKNAPIYFLLPEDFVLTSSIAINLLYNNCVYLFIFEVKNPPSYTENLKDSTRKLLELINEYSKVSGYINNIQKSFASLYTDKEKPERDIKETIPFTTATKKVIYLGINLPKETKDLQAENYDIDEINQRWHKQMEKYTMFMDQKNQYSENEYTTQSNL